MKPGKPFADFILSWCSDLGQILNYAGPSSKHQDEGSTLLDWTYCIVLFSVPNSKWALQSSKPVSYGRPNTSGVADVLAALLWGGSRDLLLVDVYSYFCLHTSLPTDDPSQTLAP